MSRIFTLSSMFLLVLLLTTACNDDPATPPPGEQTSIRVDLDPGGADFTVKLEAVDTPSGRVPGPFYLRGRNLHYNDVIGALVVDLTITNNSPATFQNPVHITFVNLLPEGTYIVDAPPGGPTFEFGFANDDLWWTPAEESLPLTVMFKADFGVSVGFNVHISVGGVQLEGAIGGIVWYDTNRNGVRDPDEHGLPGIHLGLDDGTDHENLVRTVTAPDGTYLFRDLAAGAYEVWVVDPPVELSSTTNINLHVLLAQGMGGASIFMDANFGFAEDEWPLPGPRLVVHGPHMLPLIGFRGETIMDLSVPPGAPLHFHWEAIADPGLEIQAFRWGWDVTDPNDPHDPGWAQNVPGLGPEYMEAIWDGPLEPGPIHRLVVNCWDNEEHLTRVMINFWVDAP